MLTFETGGIVSRKPPEHTVNGTIVLPLRSLSPILMTLSRARRKENGVFYPSTPLHVVSIGARIGF